VVSTAAEEAVNSLGNVGRSTQEEIAQAVSHSDDAGERLEAIAAAVLRYSADMESTLGQSESKLNEVGGLLKSRTDQLDDSYHRQGSSHYCTRCLLPGFSYRLGQ